MPRISQLPSLSSADNADEIAIVDVSASTTKKITRGDLLKAPLPTNSVTTAAIADSAVTAAKIDFTTGIWWEELGRDSSTSSRTSFSVTIPARKFLSIHFNGEGVESGIFALRFNNQSGSTDYYRHFAVLDTSYSRVSGNTSGTIIDWTSSGAPLTLDAFGRGIATGSGWKTFEIQAGGGVGGRVGTLRHKSTANITVVSIVATSGSFAFGDLIVLGHN